MVISSKMKVGILALQGDVREHKSAVETLGISTMEVRLPCHLNKVSSLIIPGGESTTIGKLLAITGLDKKIIEKHMEGMPIFGTCAGAILLAKKIIGSSQPKLGLMDIEIKRNDYGRQIDSFEATVEADNLFLGRPIKGIFIRAPVIHKAKNGCEILARFNNQPVLVRQNNLLACTFHPELTNDTRIHEFFINFI